MSNKLQLTRKALTDAPNVSTMLEIPGLVNACVTNYSQTTGQSLEKGAMIYEREKVLIMKAIADNPEIEKCDRVSVYTSIVELFVSGLTLLDGLGYLIPTKGKCRFQVGYKGRVEQLNMMPTIEMAAPAQVVYSSDDFDYTLGERPQILKHKPAKGRGIDPKDLMEFAYFLIEETNGRKVLTLMQRHEILAIRDTYSEPYKYWKSKGGKYDNGSAMKLPMWLIMYEGQIVDNPEAFKKTVINRAYKMAPKTARMKALDEKIKDAPDVEDQLINESGKIEYGISDTDDAGFAPHSEVSSDTPTEKSPPVTVVNEKKKEEAPKKKPATEDIF